MRWYERNPDLFVHERKRLARAFPDLRLDTSWRPSAALARLLRRSRTVPHPLKSVLENGPPAVTGAMVVANGLGYSTILIVPDRYPKQVPVLLCDPREIPWSVDRHVYENSGIACLCVQSEYRIHWPCGSDLTDFLRDLVRPFFVGQLYFQAHHEWPAGGERSHGKAGIVEAYRDLLRTLGRVSDTTIQEFMRLLVRKNHPRGHEACPCGGGKKLRDCHRSLPGKLRRQIDPCHARNDYNILYRSEERCSANRAVRP